MKYILMILMLVSSVYSATYYCSPSGAGSHDGTSGNEWTLAELVTAMGNDVDAAPYLSGDTILLQDGDYSAGYTTAIAGPTWVRTDWCIIKSVNGKANVTVEFFRIGGFSANPATTFAKYLQIEDVTVNYDSDPTTFAMQTYMASHVRIYNCNIIGHGYEAAGDGNYGIYLFRGHDITIKDCHIYGVGDGLDVKPNVAPEDSGTTFDPANYAKGFRTGIYHVDVYDTTETDVDIWIEGNLIEHCHDGIVIFPQRRGAGYYQDIDIVGNEVRYGTDNLILLGNGGDDYRIDDNHCHHASKFVWDGGSLGGHIDAIQPQGTDPAWCDYTNLSICNNVVHDVQHQGIFLNCGTDSADWRIEDNHVYNTPQNPNTSSVPVWIYNAQGIIFRRNRIYRSADYVGQVDVIFGKNNDTDSLWPLIDDMSHNDIRRLETYVDSGTTVTYTNYNNINLLWTESDNFVPGDSDVIYNDYSAWQSATAETTASVASPRTYRGRYD